MEVILIPGKQKKVKKLFPIVKTAEKNTKVYCKTLNICGIKLSLFTENDILVHFHFGIHYIIWLQIIKKMLCNL